MAEAPVDSKTKELPEDTEGMRAAYWKAAAIGGFAAQQLLMLDRKLQWIADELRRLQPRSPGSVLLDLQDCGPGCLGCPHPRWLKWYSPRNNRELKLLASRVKGNPALALSRTGKFKEHYPDLLALVAEAKQLLTTKTRLVELLSKIGSIVNKEPARLAASQGPTPLPTAQTPSKGIENEA